MDSSEPPADHPANAGAPRTAHGSAPRSRCTKAGSPRGLWGFRVFYLNKFRNQLVMTEVPLIKNI